MFKWMNKHPRMQKFWKLCLYYEDIYEQRLNRQGDGLLQHCSQWGKVSMVKPVITFSLFFSTKRSFWTTIFWGLSFYTIWDLLIAYRTMYLRFFKLETMLNNHFNPLITVPEISRAGVYGECVLYQNQTVFNGLMISHLEKKNVWK